MFAKCSVLSKIGFDWLNMEEKRKSYYVNLSLFLLFLVWANAYTLIKVAGRSLTPINIALLRFFMVFPFLFFFPSLYRITKIKPADIPKMILIGAMIVPLYHISLNTAETMVNASVAALIAGFSPVITAVLSAVFLKEKLTRTRIIGLVISLAGVILLNYGISGRFEVKNSLGVLLCLAAVASWAVATVTSKSLYDKYKPLDITIWGLFIGTLMLVPFIRQSFFAEMRSISLSSFLAVLYLGILAVLIGYAVWFKALEHKQASSTAAFIYINPILGSLSGVIFLKEKLTPLMIVGGIIIIIGLFFVNPLKVESK